MRYTFLLFSLLIMYSCSDMPNEVPYDSTRSVTFSVDMSEAISSNIFQEGEDTLRLILNLDDEVEMVDGDIDGVYSCTIPNLIFGKTYDYRYSINNIMETLDSNRSFTVYDEGNIISDYYGELNPTILSFSVNMSYQIELGNFNPDAQLLNIVGDLNGWVGDQLEVSDINENIYVITITDIEAGAEIEFKFRIDEEDWENPNPDISSCVDDGFGGNNRYYMVVQGENILEYWYNDEGGN